MKFKVGSKSLYSTLSSVSKVINAKNTLAVLDNFLLRVKGDTLTVTASDTENTLSAKLILTEVSGEGAFMLNARRMVDIAKELPDMDVEITFNEETLAVNTTYPGGNFDLVATDANLYPDTTHDKEEGAPVKFEAAGSQINSGIDYTLFAVGSDELRPQMMGIYWDITPDGITFAATDTRKLVRYIDRTSPTGITTSCIMPVKPCVLLKNMVSADQKISVAITDRSATFANDKFTLNCRFIKGNFPAYNRVIPDNNPEVVTVDRGTILTAIRRVAVCADPAHGLVKMRLSNNKIELKVDDVNFSTFAFEEIPCAYSGREMVIGFSSGYLLEIFNMLPTSDVLMKLADPSRPGVFEPDENATDTSLVAILMPMTVSDF